MPDYCGGSIVNLMSSIAQAFEAAAELYPPLRALPPESLRNRNIVLLVIDGLGHDNLITHCRNGALARHLQDRITSVFPPTTATAVTTFLTGTAPQQHGVTGWFTYFREIAAVLAVLPYQPRHGSPVPKVPARVLLDHVPVFDRLKARSHVVAPNRIVYSEFNAAHNGRAQPHGFATLAQMFETIAYIVRTPGERNYLYAYWPELDRLAHEHGIASREALAHLAELDRAFGSLLAEISGTSTTVIVTADHGFIDARTDQAVELATHPQLARMLSLPLCGERRAAYCYVHANERQRFVEYVAAHLAEYADLKDSRYLIEAGYFGLGPPHARLQERIGDYTLIMKDRSVIKDWLPGEPRYAQIGVHGGMCPQEMYVPLIVAEA
jgi:type I phosphodiesterase/nucleotide pyrophosphatase